VKLPIQDTRELEILQRAVGGALDNVEFPSDDPMFGPLCHVDTLFDAIERVLPCVLNVDGAVRDVIQYAAENWADDADDLMEIPGATEYLTRIADMLLDD